MAKIKVWVFVVESKEGVNVFTYGSKKELAESMIDTFDSFYGTSFHFHNLLSEVEFSSAEWLEKIKEFIEAQGEMGNYFNWAEESIEVPDAKVVVTVEGGLVQKIESSAPLEALVVDFDIEGTTNDLCEIDGNLAIVSSWCLEGVSLDSYSKAFYFSNTPNDSNT